LHAQFSALGRQAFTYGQINTELTYRAQNVQAQADGGLAFEAWKGDQHLADVHLQVVGRHNVSNALAALAVADQLGLHVSQGAEALAEFIGVGRRFEHRGQVRGIEVIDDYAHHPSEIQATLAAARTKFPQRRLWAVWQPHTYSRTRLFFQEFAQAFSDADHVVVTEVYPAREPLDPEFSSRQIVQAMEHPSAHFVSTIEEASAFLLERLEPGDVLLVLSAGDGNQICDQVLAGLKAAER
jgi:UDP-N-acetylmuramate--alanine ligase